MSPYSEAHLVTLIFSSLLLVSTLAAVLISWPRTGTEYFFVSLVEWRRSTMTGCQAGVVGGCIAISGGALRTVLSESPSTCPLYFDGSGGPASTRRGPFTVKETTSGFQVLCLVLVPDSDKLNAPDSNGSCLSFKILRGEMWRLDMPVCTWGFLH